MTRAEALSELLHSLKARNYEFIAVTPATHARVIGRQAPRTLGLRDIFGWNRPFRASDLDPEVLALLRAAEAIDERDGELRSKVRVASLDTDLLFHSAYPTEEPDSVFLGPDTYRFASFIGRHLACVPHARWLVDMGAGSGAGAIAAARRGAFDRITMVDTNPAALELARINAAVARVPADALRADQIPAGADLVIANPPYMIDSAGRTYRGGGGLFGGAMAADWARQALETLAPGGAMLLYTGAAYHAGKAPLIEALDRLASENTAMIEIEEIDPDVFGEELDQPGYEEIERIAAVGAVLTSV